MQTFLYSIFPELGHPYFIFNFKSSSNSNLVYASTLKPDLSSALISLFSWRQKLAKELISTMI